MRTADTAYNIHNQRESTVEHRELYLMLCVGNPKMGINVYMYLIHFAIEQKLTTLKSNETPINFCKKSPASFSPVSFGQQILALPACSHTEPHRVFPRDSRFLVSSSSH